MNGGGSHDRRELQALGACDRPLGTSKTFLFQLDMIKYNQLKEMGYDR